MVDRLCKMHPSCWGPHIKLADVGRLSLAGIRPGEDQEALQAQRALEAYVNRITPAGDPRGSVAGGAVPPAETAVPGPEDTGMAVEPAGAAGNVTPRLETAAQSKRAASPGTARGPEVEATGTVGEAEGARRTKPRTAEEVATAPSEPPVKNAPTAVPTVRAKANARAQ